MRVSIIQPNYSMDSNDLEKCFYDMLEQIKQCDDSMDIIVLPEYCDVPANTDNCRQFHECIEKYNEIIKNTVIETAKRCNAIVFANFADKSDNGWINTTFAFDRDGNIVGKYYKAHPAPSEEKTGAEGGNEFDCSYSYEYRKPYVIEIEGIRFGFLTCYDFYMYEGFAAIARENVDIIIGCSHQRTDTHNALDIIGRFVSYNTNAYLIRSAVSLGEDSKICGCSMIVSPKGEMLLDMKNEVGIGSCEINPNEKYYKPAGFMGKEKSHYEYLDEGRRPWLYRPAGSMIVPGDKVMSYPRICAHRGFNTVCPENSMPAFGAAIALGANEIEFDLWATKDGELVSIHDCDLDRVSNGTGNIWDYTYEELMKVDFGMKYSKEFEGLQIVKFEEILKKFACTVIMNIHVKIWDSEHEDRQYERIASLIRQYDCEKHVYMMSSSDESLEEFHKIAPEICRCVGWNGVKDKPLEIVDRAIKLGCEKVQLFKPYFNQESVIKARNHGIICNVFWADDPDEAIKYLKMGIDTILTNDYFQISRAVKKYIEAL